MKLCRSITLSVVLLLKLTLPSITVQAEDSSLEQTCATVAEELDAIASNCPGTIGFEVATADGEVLFSRHAEDQFPQASAIKIPLLMEVIAEREEGRISWNAPHQITKQVQVGGSGVLFDFSDGGSSICTADLCVLMIVVSDNTATNLLIDLVRMENVNRRLDELNCPRTRLRRMMMDMAASERGEENVSTPQEAVRIMRLLAQGKFASDAVSTEILDILRKPKSTAVRKAIPSEITIASKPGGIPGVATEWALVDHPERPYVIALMGKDGDEATFRDTFTKIARIVHTFVTARQ